MKDIYIYLLKIPQHNSSEYHEKHVTYDISIFVLYTIIYLKVTQFNFTLQQFTFGNLSEQHNKFRP